MVLCASGRHEDVINSTLLDFSATRQQLEDGAFTYKLSEFLRDKVERRRTAAPTAVAATSGSATRPAARASKAVDATVNPQKGVLETNSNDTWQVFIDHAGSAPIPNMCCRWHLNGKCVKNCFNAASHIQLDATQIEAVKAWIEKCHARMPRSSTDARSTKKQKLGHSDFVGRPTFWSGRPGPAPQSISPTATLAEGRLIRPNDRPRLVPRAAHARRSPPSYRLPAPPS